MLILLQLLLLWRSVSAHRVLVSYAFLISENIKVWEISSQCSSNLDTFIERAVKQSDEVEFVFIRMGQSIVPDSLQRAIRRIQNVRMVEHHALSTDLQAHGFVIAQYIDSFNYFILLNCGARGPYHMSMQFKWKDRSILDLALGRPRTRTPKPNLEWVQLMTVGLKGNIHAVGATISCEVAPHIQSYAMAITQHAASLLSKLWNSDDMKNMIGSNAKSRSISMGEIGGSQLLLSRGLGIAALDSRSDEFLCPNNTSLSHLLNPTACYLFNKSVSVGCMGLEPCEVLFVKYGGDVLLQGLIARITRSRVTEEDTRWLRAKHPKMCGNPTTTTRPDWNVSLLANETLLLPANTFLHSIDFKQVLIMIRSHSGYRKQLRILLKSLSLMPAAPNMSIFILPTEPFDSMALHSATSRFSRSSQAFLLNFPSNLYSNLDTYLHSICSKDYRRFMIRANKVFELQRYCTVNSALHYLLVDITLEIIKMLCTRKDSKLLVTNADNYYSSRFFDALLANPSADIVMTNMVSRGSAMVTRPVVAGIDLGSYAVSISFLRKTNITFLNALPERVLPDHYHNADGHFVEHIIAHGARVKKIDEFLFFHN